MKVWITKYALTKGIVEADVEVSESSPDTIVLKNEKNGRRSFFHRGSWFRDPAEASAAAIRMRNKKIASLLRQISILESLEF